MELKIKVHSKPRIEYEARNVNGHESTAKERECMIEEFKRRNADKFECVIADNVDLATCQYLLIQAFGSGGVDWSNVELVQFTHKFENLTLDFEIVLKFEGLKELTLHEERLQDYIYDWMYCEGAHIWLVDGWFGQNNVECYHFIYADESNTDISIEWKTN